MSRNNESKVQPLFKKWGSIASKDLSDELYAIAYNIEQTLISAGAIPEKDYGYLDLIKLAQPFVVEMYRTDKGISYIYPADEVIKP